MSFNFSRKFTLFLRTLLSGYAKKGLWRTFRQGRPKDACIALTERNGVSEAIFKVGMCLPAGPYVTDDDVKYIVDCIKNAIL